MADLAALPPPPPTEASADDPTGRVSRRVNQLPIMHGPGPDAPPPRGAALADAQAETPEVAGH
jgi:hypothetical protein